MHYQCTEHSNSSDSDELYFYYDSNGYLTGIEYNGNNLYTATNRRGDVLAIYKNTGECIARYEYDAWGNVISVIDCDYYDATQEKIIEKDITNDTSSTDIAMVNPIRYRGYYYDVETKFYYLQSRYYNPEVGRFLNADGYLTTGQGVLSYNMFAYCQNNPVMYSDPSGRFSVFSLLVGALVVGALTLLSGCSKKTSNTTTTAPTTSSSNSTSTTLTNDQKVLIATIAGEATVTDNNKPVSSEARQAMANVALNRVGCREWSEYSTVAEICEYTGFDAFGGDNYNKCMEYLNNRDGSNATYEDIIWDVMQAYESDITGGCQLYYTPATMSPPGSSPNWNFELLVEVNIPGVDPYYEGRFYKYTG